jgi:transposase
MAKKYAVSLSDEERERLRLSISSGRSPAREQAHARVLLRADAGETDQAIAAAVDVSGRTVARVRRRFAEGGLDAAVARRPQPARPGKRVLDGAAEARLVTLACSRPPDGHGRWTLDLLADQMVRLSVVPAVSRDTVRRAMKKT